PIDERGKCPATDLEQLAGGKSGGEYVPADIFRYALQCGLHINCLHQRESRGRACLFRNTPNLLRRRISHEETAIGFCGKAASPPDVLGRVSLKDGTEFSAHKPVKESWTRQCPGTIGEDNQTVVIVHSHIDGLQLNR